MADLGVILFYTTSAAFAAERALVRAGVECTLVPPPRELSSDCGLAARFAWDQVDEVHRVLEEAGVETAGTHRLD